MPPVELSEHMRRMDRYRPAHPPYQKASELGYFNAATFTEYAAQIVTYLATKKSISVNESYYLFFLSKTLVRVGSKDASLELDRVVSVCKVTDLRSHHVDDAGPTVKIPGLENVIKASWRFLPNPENLSAGELIEILKLHFAQHTGGQNIIFEIKRIEFALSLDPKQICVGLDEFAGYYAFLFSENVVLFECPAYGNAAYIVRGDWQILSQQYKAQLQRKGVRVVHGIHSWKWKIRRAIKNA